MIRSIEFANVKALRKTTLPLAPFTLLLGPNGSGKSTVLQMLREIAALIAQSGNHIDFQTKYSTPHSSLLSVTAETPTGVVEVKLHLHLRKKKPVTVTTRWDPQQRVVVRFTYQDGTTLQQDDVQPYAQWLRRMQVFALHPPALATAVPVSDAGLQPDGTGLAAVLDDLKDNHPERWDQLLAEMRRWLPEYDHIQFDKPQQGTKVLALRTRKGGHRIPAGELSQGTLLALALLTLAYVPEPPSLVGLEEIDRGLHPRLLRHLQDALYRLSYPASCGETRPPIQVIATTHSPYLLDLYRDHPEEVVLAQKEGLEVKMKRLADMDHYQEILGDSPLSEVWYSGVLGGVSVKP